MKSTILPGPATAIRIVVADQAVVRFGVKSMLGHDPEVRIVGEAGDGEAAAAQALKLQPDILLLDLQMPGSSGLEAIKEISRPSPRVRMILFTGAITPLQSGSNSPWLEESSVENPPADGLTYTSYQR